MHAYLYKLFNIATISCFLPSCLNQRLFRSGLQSYFKPLDNFLSYSDEDECSLENLVRFCPGPGICTNSDGGFTCDCPDGYEPAPIGCQG